MTEDDMHDIADSRAALRRQIASSMKMLSEFEEAARSPNSFAAEKIDACIRRLRVSIDSENNLETAWRFVAESLMERELRDFERGDPAAGKRANILLRAHVKNNIVIGFFDEDRAKARVFLKQCKDHYAKSPPTLKSLFGSTEPSALFLRMAATLQEFSGLGN